MKFGGFIECSFNDWPDRLCCVAFVKGCNMRCRYCHNPDLVNGTGPEYTEEEILEKIKKLDGKLNNLCLTGGEPLIYGSKAVKDFCKKVKEINSDFKIKLDTNGISPKELDEVLYEKTIRKTKKGVTGYTVIKNGLVDYVALDFKAGSYIEYNKLVKTDTNKLMFNSIPFVVMETLCCLLKSDIPFEIRTTVIEGFHKKEDLDFMYRLISNGLSKRKEDVTCYIQKYRPEVTLEADKEWKTPSDEYMEEIVELGNKYGLDIKIR